MSEIKISLIVGLGIELLALLFLGVKLWVILLVMVLSLIALSIMFQDWLKGRKPFLFADLHCFFWLYFGGYFMKRKILFSWLFLVLALCGVVYGVFEILQTGNSSNPAHWLVPIGFLVLSLSGLFMVRKFSHEWETNSIC